MREHLRIVVLRLNDIRERFHKTIMEELYQVALRKKIYNSIEELQVDLDGWLVKYNQHRPHQRMQPGEAHRDLDRFETPDGEKAPHGVI